MAPTTLREQQAAVTRGLILQALADVVTEEGVDGFSVQQVADRAGVSHRTVYRHFPTREALLDGLAGWIDDRLREAGVPVVPDDPDRLGEVLGEVFEAFGSMPDLVHALVAVATGAGARLANRERRDAEFRRVLSDVTCHLDPDEAEAAFGALRALASSTFWHVLTDERRLTSEQAATVGRWLFDLALADLRAGGGPARRGGNDGDGGD